MIQLRWIWQKNAGRQTKNIFFQEINENLEVSIDNMKKQEKSLSTKLEHFIKQDSKQKEYIEENDKENLILQERLTELSNIAKSQEERFKIVY